MGRSSAFVCVAALTPSPSPIATGEGSRISPSLAAAGEGRRPGALWAWRGEGLRASHLFDSLHSAWYAQNLHAAADITFCPRSHGAWWFVTRSRPYTS